MVFAGCASTSDPYSTNGVQRGHTATAGSNGGATGSAAGSAATGSGTGGGGSTASGGSSSGTTGTCLPPGISDCTDGSKEISISLIDICTQQPVTSPIQATALGSSATSSSLPCGVIYFCVPAGTDLTPQLTAPGYAPEILETLQVQTSRAYTELPLICTGLLTGLTEAGGNGSVVAVEVGAVEGKPACADLSGWSFSLTDLDGGAVTSKSVYFSGEYPDPSATATTASGLAIVYNISSAATDVIVVGESSTSKCSPANAEEQWTNQVHLANQSASLAPFLIDTDGGVADAGM